MKYGIVENHKFILIDEDRQRLENTLPFMPQFRTKRTLPHTKTSEIEQGHDRAWYEKGHAPQRPLEEARTEKLAELEAAFDTASREAHMHLIGRVRDRCRRNRQPQHRRTGARHAAGRDHPVQGL